jgi:RimJ/RimL family protein N-acetyltransferase
MQKAFEKAGWEYEGRLKKLFMHDGVAEDYLSFAKTI